MVTLTISPHSPHPMHTFKLPTCPVLLCLIVKFFPMYVQLAAFFPPAPPTKLACSLCHERFCFMLTPRSPSTLKYTYSSRRHLLKTFLKPSLAGINISCFSTSITVFFLFSWSCHFLYLHKTLMYMFFSLDTVDLIHLFFPAKLFAQHFVLSSVDSKCLLIKYNNNNNNLKNPPR